ncbi:TPA: hypothetical protein ACW47E_004689 [Salmonella enterica subsp. enterica serovar Nagoya]
MFRLSSAHVMRASRLSLVLLAGIPVSTVTAASIQVGFSPEVTAQQVVLNTINQSQKSVRLMAYSFTSPEVVRALINARKRGVENQPEPAAVDQPVVAVLCHHGKTPECGRPRHQIQAPQNRILSRDFRYAPPPATNSA